MILFFAEFISPRDERENFVVDRKNIISLNASLHDRGDLKLPSFGIISNRGEIEFNDFNGSVLKKIQYGAMSSYYWDCDIFIENTLAKNSKTRTAQYIAASWAYDDENKTVRVELKDDLEDWQNIMIEAIPYDAKTPKEQTLKWFYETLHDITVNKHNYNMLSFDSLDERTKEVLNTTVIKYPLLYAGSLWASWDKVCEVGLLHIYKENGVVKCRYNGGN